VRKPAAAASPPDLAQASGPAPCGLLLAQPSSSEHPFRPPRARGAAVSRPAPNFRRAVEGSAAWMAAPPLRPSHVDEPGWREVLDSPGEAWPQGPGAALAAPTRASACSWTRPSEPTWPGPQSGNGPGAPPYLDFAPEPEELPVARLAPAQRRPGPGTVPAWSVSAPPVPNLVVWAWGSLTRWRQRHRHQSVRLHWCSGPIHYGIDQAADRAELFARPLAPAAKLSANELDPFWTTKGPPTWGRCAIRRFDGKACTTCCMRPHGDTYANLCSR